MRFYKLFAYIWYYTKEVYLGYTKLQISLHFLLLLQVMALYVQTLGPKFGPRVSTCEPWPPNVRLCSDRPAPPSGQWLINKARPSADPHNSSNQLSMASSITGHCCNYSLDCRPCHRQCWYFIGPPGAGQLRRLYRYIYYIYLYTEYWFYYSWLGLQKVNFSLSDCDLGIIFF